MGKLPGKIEAEAILGTLAKLRESIPFELMTPPPEWEAPPIAALEMETIEEFELATVAEGLHRLNAELSEALVRVNAKLLDDCLDVYYATEELARDPANAHLIPLVESMRKAFEHDYGVPIPAKDGSR
jgi:hypothetical protein